jgi:hypothetical protein
LGFPNVLWRVKNKASEVEHTAAIHSPVTLPIRGVVGIAGGVLPSTTRSGLNSLVRTDSWSTHASVKGTFQIARCDLYQGWSR